MHFYNAYIEIFFIKNYYACGLAVHKTVERRNNCLNISQKYSAYM